MVMKKKYRNTLESLSKMAPLDGKTQPEARDIQERIKKGRGLFNEVTDRIFSSVMKISSLDLMMHHGHDKVIKVCSDLKDISSEVVEAANRAQKNVTDVVDTHENFIRSVNSVGDSAEQIRKEMEQSKRQIDEVAEETSQIARNMDQFVRRAGESGAENLEEITQGLVGIRENIAKISEYSQRRQDNITRIIEDITTIAASGEEIFGAVSNIESVVEGLNAQIRSLDVQMDDLSLVAGELQESAEPIVSIENELDESAKMVGQMVEDVFYTLENPILIKNMKNAVTAHMKWLQTLEKMLQKGECTPLQIDDTKCSFGHFYYAVHPKNSEILPIWDGLGDMHRKFHGHGRAALAAMEKGDMESARKEYEEASQISNEMIGDFNQIIEMIEVKKEKDALAFL